MRGSGFGGGEGFSFNERNYAQFCRFRVRRTGGREQTLTPSIGMRSRSERVAQVSGYVSVLGA